MAGAERVWRTFRRGVRYLAAISSMVGCAGAMPDVAPGGASGFPTAIAGEWSGEPEYADYRSGKRVTLPTEMRARRLDDHSVELAFDFREPSGEVVTNTVVHRLASDRTRYVADDDTVNIVVLEGFDTSARRGRTVTTGTVEENDLPVEVRQALFVTADSLRLLKGTRSPLQFRNEYRVRRR